MEEKWITVNGKHILINDDEQEYFNPNTGEGGYTKEDMEQSLEREFHYIDEEDYKPYIKDRTIEAYTEDFIEENGIDPSDKEEYQKIKDDIEENPDYYMSWEDISEAKEEYLEKFGTRDSDWIEYSEERRKEE